jgi:hypothetical protein
LHHQEASKRSIASAFSPSTPFLEDLGHPDFARLEPLTRSNALPFATPRPLNPGVQTRSSPNRPDFVMGSITISRSKDHTPDISQVTLGDFDLLNPTSRWMSAHKLCGFRADLKQGQAACICTTKPFKPHSRCLWMPMNSGPPLTALRCQAE